jgi:hypothetical protein
MIAFCFTIVKPKLKNKLFYTFIIAGGQHSRVDVFYCFEV